MIEINRYNEIIISRGDDITIDFSLTGDTENIVSHTFKISKFFDDGTKQSMLEKTFAKGEPIVLTSAETEDLEAGNYKYDIEISYSNGKKYTLDKPKCLVVKEVC